MSISRNARVVAALFLAGFQTYQAQAETWTANLSAYATSISRTRAYNTAGGVVANEFNLFDNLCMLRNGSRTTELFEGRCFPERTDEYLCWTHGNYMCDIGPLNYLSSQPQLPGEYFDPAQGAYLKIAADHSFRTSITSPFSGGTILRSRSQIARNGETTYVANAEFVGMSNCTATAQFQFTKLSDGRLILVVTSPQRVRAVILGRCYWEGTLSKYYELKPIQ